MRPHVESPATPSDEIPAGIPRFSVIVPAYDRSLELGRLLDALGRQAFPREEFEVIVCDDGSSEDLIPIIEHEADEHDLRVVYLRQTNRGPGEARNLGLAHARGEIVASTDSDCIPGPTWLTAFDRAFSDPGLGLAGGPVGFREARHLSGRCVNFLMSSTIGAGGARDPRGLVAMKFYPRTGNLAVRRHLALGVGGFPRHTSGEDLEFSHRVAQRCGPPGFVADASVLHDEQSNLVAIFRESMRKGAARVRLRRTCRLHQAIHMVPAALVLVLLGSLAVLPSEAARPWALLPWIAYAAALILVGVQGAITLGEFRAVAAIPLYAALMHVGYGSGYLAATAGTLGPEGDPRTRDWESLRQHASPVLFGPMSRGSLAD